MVNTSGAGSIESSWHSTFPSRNGPDMNSFQYLLLLVDVPQQAYTIGPAFMEDFGLLLSYLHICIAVIPNFLL